MYFQKVYVTLVFCTLCNIIRSEIPISLIAAGKNVLINNGTTDYFFSTLQTAVFRPIDDETSSIDLKLASEFSNVSVTFNFASFDMIEGETGWKKTSDTPTILFQNTTFSGGNKLTLSPSDSDYKYSLTGSIDFFCQNDGRSFVNITVDVTSSETTPIHQTGALNFVVVKDCNLSKNDPCKGCGTCIQDGSCSCNPSALGVVCYQAPSSKSALRSADAVKLISYNVNGWGLNEDSATISDRMNIIGSQLSDKDFDVIVLQEVWSESAREALVTVLEVDYPYIAFNSYAFDASIGDMGSGLFLASKLPFVEQSFTNFLTSSGYDTSVDKGFLITEFELETSTLVLVSLHLQSNSVTTGAVASKIRETQLGQMMKALLPFVQEVAATQVKTSMAVLLAGDFNIDASSDEYSAMLNTLESPRDVLKELNVKSNTYGFGEATINCTAEVYESLQQSASDVRCTVGDETATIANSKRVDYIFAYDTFVIPDTDIADIDDYTLASLTFSNGIVNKDDPYSAASSPISSLLSYGGFLSDHRPVETTYQYLENPDYSGWGFAGSVIVFLLISIAIIINRCSIKQIDRLPTDDDRDTGVVKVLWRQVMILMYKNILVLKRSRKALITQLFIPFLFVGFLSFLQIAIDYNLQNNDDNGDRPSPALIDIATIPRCFVKNDYPSCYSLAYTPMNDNTVTDIMNRIASDNGIPSSELLGFKNSTFLNEYLFDNPERVLASVNFDITSEKEIEYYIQYNQTLEYKNGEVIDKIVNIFLPIQRSVEKELLRIITGDNELKFDPSLAPFPHPTVGAVDVISDAGPSFFFGALMFNFVIQIGQIVTEKEFLLRQGMEVMGMNLYIYWITWLITNLVMNTITSALLILAGWIFQIRFFTLNDPLLYLLLFFWFGAAMVSFACLCSIFVSKGRTATNVGFALYLVGVIGQGFVSILYSNTVTDIYRFIANLFPFILLGQGVSSLASFSSSSDSTGLRWQKRFEDNDIMPLDSIYIWLLCLSVVYFILAVLIDRFVASEDPRLLCRGTGTESATVGDVNRDNGKPEEVSQEETRVENAANNNINFAVKISKLVKSYYSYKFGLFPDKSKDYRAVNGLTIGIEEGELLCLLGPNGAGKTTTIKILTGVHAATGGSASVFGNSVRSKTGMDQIRKSMGVCPQHDILWDELTAKEHLRIFCGFKNIPENLVEAEVSARLEDVKLTKWGNAPTSSYSGGMKRRLSVAMSLIGNPKIVFLDEPTTGMDPVSRRQVWDLIEYVKHGRVIVLTTHSMEEADILGDRIAIMKKGELTTIGNSIALKKKYGNGYRIKAICDANLGSKKVLELICKFIPDPLILKQSEDVIEIELNREQTTQLPVLVKLLEGNEGTSAGVTDVVLSISTLQEVFLKIAENQTSSEKTADVPLETGVATGDTGMKDASKEIEMTAIATTSPNNDNHKNHTAGADKAITPEIANPSYDFKLQMGALFTKSALVQRAAMKTNLCQILIPAALLMLLYGVQLLIDNLIDFSFPQNLQPSPSPFVLFDDDAFAYFGCSDNFGNIKSSSDDSFFVYSVENPNQIDYVGTYTDESFWEASEPGSGLLGNSSMANFQLKGHRPADGPVQGPPYCFSDVYFAGISFTKYGSKGDVNKLLYNRWGEGAGTQGGFIFNNMDSSSNTYDFTLMSNKTISSNADYPLFLNFITDALVKMVADNTTASIRLSGSADYPTLERPFVFDITSIVGPILFLYVFQLSFPVILSNMVYEKEHKLREVMKMMGLKQHVYWIVTYIFAFLFYATAVTFLIILAAIVDFRFFVTNDVTLVIVFFAIWGNVLVAFSFFMSTFFTSTKSATVVGNMIVFAFGILGDQLARPYLDNPNTPSSTIVFIQLFPQFVLQQGLIELGNGVAFGRPGLKWSELSYPGENLDSVMIVLVIHWFVWMTLAMYFEACFPSPIGVKKHPLFPLFWIRDMLCGGKSNKSGANNNNNNNNNNAVLATGAPSVNEYEDVKRERERVNADDSIALRILGLKKTYPGVNGGEDVQAVKDLTIGVSAGECVGFLGPNGAGKSTTMNMLCGYFGPTAGTAKVFGFDVRTDMNAIHMLLGVCPQENVLWEHLSGRQHLSFYGKVKGLRGHALTTAIDYRLSQVGLLEDGDKASGEYSGGMKRRLCVAIALVGNPRVVILDEPSTGLDPKSRNDLWNVIKEETKRAAVLLTTHSMEEAENLCSNIGIFISGRLRCLGTAEDLKHRLGDGFHVHVVCKSTDVVEEVDEYLMKSLPKLQLLNSLNGTRNYQIGTSSASLSDILDVFMNEDAHAVRNIEDWGVENTTLEQVFVEIVREGDNQKDIE